LLGAAGLHAYVAYESDATVRDALICTVDFEDTYLAKLR